MSEETKAETESWTKLDTEEQTWTKLDTTSLSVSEAAQLLGVSDKTLRRWDANGVLVPLRSPTGRRIYTRESIEAFRKIQGLPEMVTSKPQKSMTVDDVETEIDRFTSSIDAGTLTEEQRLRIIQAATRLQQHVETQPEPQYHWDDTPVSDEYWTIHDRLTLLTDEVRAFDGRTKEKTGLLIMVRDLSEIAESLFGPKKVDNCNVAEPIIKALSSLSQQVDQSGVTDEGRQQIDDAVSRFRFVLATARSLTPRQQPDTAAEFDIDTDPTWDESLFSRFHRAMLPYLSEIDEFNPVTERDTVIQFCLIGLVSLLSAAVKDITHRKNGDGIVEQLSQERHYDAILARLSPEEYEAVDAALASSEPLSEIAKRIGVSENYLQTRRAKS